METCIVNGIERSEMILTILTCACSKDRERQRTEDKEGEAYGRQAVSRALARGRQKGVAEDNPITGPRHTRHSTVFFEVSEQKAKVE